MKRRGYFDVIKETKHNEWFRNSFLESFGFCESKTISEKQANIFKKYLEEEQENWRNRNAFYYSGIISGKKIRLQCSFVCKREIFILTIRHDTEKEENQIREEIKALNVKFDAAIERNANDSELDAIEDMIDKCYDRLDELKKY